MFPGRYSEIFGLGERLGCILNFGHSFGAVERVFEFAPVCVCHARCCWHIFALQAWELYNA